MKIRLGTRSTPLARVQAQNLKDRLLARWKEIEVEIVEAESIGDRDQTTPLTELSRGRGDLWADELRDLLLGGRIDAAVHSLKDVDLQGPHELVLAAFPEREDARDAWVAREARPPRTAGTCSLRRSLQLERIFPGVVCSPIRGSVGRRIEQVQAGAFDGTVLALAGLRRAGFEARASRIFPLEDMVPCAGQGSLVAECRRDDGPTREILAGIDAPRVREASEAEREIHRRLGIGLDAAFAVHLAPRGDSWRLLARDFRPSARLCGALLDLDDADLGRLVALALERLGPGSRRAPGRKRILVTRCPEDFAATRDLCASLNLIALPFPLLRRERLSLPEIPRGDWAIFTSPASVALWPEAFPPGERIACVGPATEEAANGRSWKTHFIPSRATAEDLAREWPGKPGETAVLPVSRGGGEPLLSDLSRRGVRVQRVDLYDTISTAPDEDALKHFREGFEAVLFASPSAVEAWNERMGRAALGRATLLSIGPSTTAACRKAGFPDPIEGPSGLLPQLLRLFADPHEPHA
ncbi:MAG: hydroxymethylbilane synthase [Spirochaetes bacterium]|nr:hydroxymethylbilane synthase [Spirochaetota bacterium]